MNTFFEIINIICVENHVNLIYGCVFGSKLYGLETKNSDLDIMGIYEGTRESIHFSSSEDNVKNSKNDIDVDLISVSKFRKMLNSGEMKALDLFFSHTNKDCIIYCNPYFYDFFNQNIIFSYDMLEKYILNELGKYGVKNSRIWAFNKFYDEIAKIDDNLHLYTVSDRITYNKYVVLERGFINVCGKLLNLRDKIKNIKQLLNVHKYTFSIIAKPDYKAISHCIRAIEEYEQFKQHGYISFPISNITEIMKVKNKLIGFNEGIRYVEQKLEEIK